MTKYSNICAHGSYFYSNHHIILVAICIQNSNQHKKHKLKPKYQYAILHKFTCYTCKTIHIKQYIMVMTINYIHFSIINNILTYFWELLTFVICILVTSIHYHLPLPCSCSPHTISSRLHVFLLLFFFKTRSYYVLLSGLIF